MMNQVEYMRGFGGEVERAELNFGRKKNIAVTPYKGYVYIHIGSLTSSRSITLGTDEFKELCNLKPVLLKAEAEIKKQRKVIAISDSDEEAGVSESDVRKVIVAAESGPFKGLKKKKKTAGAGFILSEAVEDGE
ncbi:Hypothetical predicted protein [Mytilus galloprovincialis]|uniref:Uncharacterized protein n=1 Tax=Mytilus galloprovincialis TaxID=29158 RepID=A0A8B6HCH7_MYTGA|nr:Hypothetical predicted protein [Mytilus galloprovincialis]